MNLSAAETRRIQPDDASWTEAAAAGPTPIAVLSWLFRRWPRSAATTCTTALNERTMQRPGDHQMSATARRPPSPVTE
jgi:hypothetical protein